MATTNKSGKKDYKSELDAIKLEFYKFAKEKGDEHGHNSLHLECFPPEYNKAWIKFLQQIEKKIDALTLKVPANDKLRLNLILIKSFCVIRILLGLKVTDQKTFVRVGEPRVVKCEEVLRPYKNKAEGVWLYVMNQVVHVQLIDFKHTNSMLWLSEKCQKDFVKAFKLIEDADKHYTNFINYQMEKPWGIDEIFCCYDAKGNQMKSKLADDFWMFRQYTIKALLMEYAVKTQNDESIRKHGLDGLRTYMQGHKYHNHIHSLVRFAGSVVQAFTNNHYFKQAQHIIAVVMYSVVQFRRSLPPEERTTVNPIQYDASFLYAEFGNRLVRKSYELIMEEFMRRSLSNLEGHKNYHHDDCERLMPKSKELTQYEKQYPTQLTLDNEVYEKMRKKIRQWLDRMEELERASTAPEGLCIGPWPVVFERLQMIKSAVILPTPTLNKE